MTPDMSRLDWQDRIRTLEAEMERLRMQVAKVKQACKVHPEWIGEGGAVDNAIFRMRDLEAKLAETQADLESWRTLPVAMREHGVLVGDYPVNVAAVVAGLKADKEQAKAKLAEVQTARAEMFGVAEQYRIGWKRAEAKLAETQAELMVVREERAQAEEQEQGLATDVRNLRAKLAKVVEELERIAVEDQGTQGQTTRIRGLVAAAKEKP